MKNLKSTTLEALEGGTAFALKRYEPLVLPGDLGGVLGVPDEIDGLPSPWAAHIAQVQGRERWIGLAGHGSDMIDELRALPWVVEVTDDVDSLEYRPGGLGVQADEFPALRVTVTAKPFRDGRSNPVGALIAAIEDVRDRLRSENPPGTIVTFRA